MQRLKKRNDYVKVARGARTPRRGFLLQSIRRPDAADNGAEAEARFGFTVTKKLGKANVRNRIRRRLKAAITSLAAQEARDGFDYVIVARPAALERAYPEMVSDLTRAFKGVHKPQAQSQQRLDKHPNTMKKPDRRGHA